MRKKKQSVIDHINSFIGKEVKFDGNLTFTGSVKIDGHLKGEVRASEGHLIVGDTGVVQADIQVSSVLCSGEIRGKIAATESINVRVPGKVFGDIQAPTIVLQEGVQFEGSCKTTPPDLAGAAKDKAGTSSVKPFPSDKQSSQNDASVG